MQHTLTILTTGRNDNYDGNFNERLIFAFEQNINRIPEAEFIFVEWNPIPDTPLVCEELKKVFDDKIKYYVVHPDFHNQYCTFDDFNEYPSKNVAIRRATTEFVLSINSDIILSPEVIDRLKGPLNRNKIYRATRVDIRPDYLRVRFPLHPKFIIEENKGHTNACGDFLLMDRNTWFDTTGYIEAFPEQRLHKDSELVWRLCDKKGLPLEFLGQITHWRHPSSWSNMHEKRGKVGDIFWNFKKCDFIDNGKHWGLKEAEEENRDGIIWLIEKKNSKILKPEVPPSSLIQVPISDLEMPLNNIDDPSEKRVQCNIICEYCEGCIDLIPKEDYSCFKGTELIVPSYRLLPERPTIMKTALVLGGHGFIGHHLARDLKKQGFWVRTVDIKEFPYDDKFKNEMNDYVIGDLRDFEVCKHIFRAPNGKSFDEVYQLAAWMGGAGVVFSQEYDSKIMHDSLLININVVEWATRTNVGKLFYSSSACIYNQENQKNTENPTTSEDSAYPAYPDSDYGWEKLISEHLYLAYNKNRNLNVRIARFHNVMGPEGAWGNGREKSPAAICRKIAQTANGYTIEIWGDGKQTRSYLYIDECLKGIRKLMDSEFIGPVNIGSDEMVSINRLVDMVKEIAHKPNISINHISGPLGVRGRTSDNNLIKKELNWAPNYPLKKALKKTYSWIKEQVDSGKEDYQWTN